MLIYYQCWKPVILFSGFLKNEKLNKNSIYLKCNFSNNIHYHSKVWDQYLLIFLKKFVFIQQGLVKCIEFILLENISILNKSCSFYILFINEPQKINRFQKMFYKKKKNQLSSTSVSNIDHKSHIRMISADHALKTWVMMLKTRQPTLHISGL